MLKGECRVGSLFSGVGGIDLGLERAGCKVVWQCETDPYCVRVLSKHWPHVPNLGDVRFVEWTKVAPVDLIAGGFPCQPVSNAGRRFGQSDPRWLWPWFAAAIRSLRPRFVFVENVPGLLTRGMGDVLGDLASCGYDTEWDCIPAAAFGAPQLRYRVVLIAYSRGDRPPFMADTEIVGERTGLCESESTAIGWRRPGDRGGKGHPWATEPDVGRVAPRISAGLDKGLMVGQRANRLRSLGNSVVPQLAEWVGQRFLSEQPGHLGSESPHISAFRGGELPDNLLQQEIPWSETP